MAATPQALSAIFPAPNTAQWVDEVPLETPSWCWHGTNPRNSSRTDGVLSTKQATTEHCSRLEQSVSSSASTGKKFGIINHRYSLACCKFIADFNYLSVGGFRFVGGILWGGFTLIFQTYQHICYHTAILLENLQGLLDYQQGMWSHLMAS